MPNLPAPGTALLTVTWDTVVGEEWTDEGPDEPPHVVPVTIGDRVLDMLANRLLDETRREVKATVRAALTDAIRDQVSGIVTETLTGEIRMTNHYGEPTGEPTTLRAMIAKQATDFLSVKDSENRYGTPIPGFASLLKTEVDQALTKELQSTILEARKQVAEAVKERAGELLGGVINSTAPRR